MAKSPSGDFVIQHVETCMYQAYIAVYSPEY